MRRVQLHPEINHFQLWEQIDQVDLDPLPAHLFRGFLFLNWSVFLQQFHECLEDLAAAVPREGCVHPLPRRLYLEHVRIFPE